MTEPTHEVNTKMSETEIRMNAICAEYRAAIIAQADRAAALAAELAVQARRAVELTDKIAELTKQAATEPTGGNAPGLKVVENPHVAE